MASDTGEEKLTLEAMEYSIDKALFELLSDTRVLTAIEQLPKINIPPEQTWWQSSFSGPSFVEGAGAYTMPLCLVSDLPCTDDGPLTIFFCNPLVDNCRLAVVKQDILEKCDETREACPEFWAPDYVGIIEQLGSDATVPDCDITIDQCPIDPETGEPIVVPIFTVKSLRDAFLE